MSESADDLFRRGTALLAEARFDEAIAALEQANQLRPGHAETLGNIGVAHAELGRNDEAVRWYNAALEVRPTYPEALYNRGNSHRLDRRYEQAIADYDAALQLAASFPQAWVNRGLALMRLGRAADAVTSYRQAINAVPNYAEAFNNVGLALQVMGYTEDAIDRYESALRVRPDYPAARCNRAQAWLLKGDFRRGWPEYEWRWGVVPSLPVRDLPTWDGSPLGGKSILLRHEQGLGDTIQFIRYASIVKARGGRVVLECPERLHALLKGVPGVDALTTRDDPDPKCNLQLPLLSLPGLVRTDFRSIPSPKPYLAADAKRVRRIKAKLPEGKLRVGICWQGSPDFPEDAFRSIPLAAFAPLAAVPGVKLVSLQHGHGVEQIAPFREQHELHELPDDLDADGAFLDTAAAMKALDLVVTSDTAIAHLAGAMGRPVWIALSTAAEWRWLRDREDSPWYPTARLFRQRTVGDWPDVFARIVEALTEFEP